MVIFDSEFGAYMCERCNLHYNTSELARECENWDMHHNSCNLRISRQSVEVASRKYPV
ncbi:hypothetical protein M1439_00160 [Candidatus Marsarchaeota archaeon]|nr:hypothetical protein [Candidatus Marsarchaeota archaeon]MCL5092162.1 hypothetical protein [Candidatus Marsarchaeota archaeon]